MILSTDRRCDCVNPAEYGHSAYCPLEEIDELRAVLSAITAACRRKDFSLVSEIAEKYWREFQKSTDGN